MTSIGREIKYNFPVRNNISTKIPPPQGGFNYVINSMMLIAIIGMCIKIFFGSRTSKDGTNGPANSVIYGYGLVALSILTVIFVTFTKFILKCSKFIKQLMKFFVTI